ncbi:ACT domain [Arabidopsis thaliana x Arabidopsis arenosa]|uniref:ACT domain-containing protein ACR n=2 Tax=Arabidopsis TaxID=3701 RepID=A0A8T1ZHA4_9BRAS|nr:ACT domain [Arabidopsis thaliana x Arabidopsis arenosa]KAG7558657.1 ACT domain [Arabidopsis thaliana x Arabidopsis arenosa]KAG7563460.1 ACT domain [Arabidopsis suecica]
MDVCLSYSYNMDDEIAKFIRRVNPPRVVIDNEVCKDVTVIKVDSANKHGILLEVVQVLTELNLTIKKAYISSDGGWFMDVFNVTDQDGNKVTDEIVLDYIRKSLGPDESTCFSPSMRSTIGVKQSVDYTVIELTGTDRPGLLSELCAVLMDLQCNVVNAEIWTHRAKAAAVLQVTDEETCSAITDPERLSKIRKLLGYVLTGGSSGRRFREPKTTVSSALDDTHTDRKLHQLMFADRDYDEWENNVDDEDKCGRVVPDVDVSNLHDLDYSIVMIKCKDRPKLLFDTVFTLTDMKYVVSHASIDAEGPEAYQEYYIRHTDGSPVKSEAERQRVIKCLKAAIQRRVSEGLKLELCTSDRVGLLSDVTRIFRENSLTVTRAEVKTKGDKALNTFYVRDASGYQVDAKTIESIRQVIGQTILQVKGGNTDAKPSPQDSPTGFLFGVFKSRSFVNFGLIRS